MSFVDKVKYVRRGKGRREHLVEATANVVTRFMYIPLGCASPGGVQKHRLSLPRIRPYLQRGELIENN